MKKILRVIPIIMATIAVFAVSTLSWLAADYNVSFPSKFGGSTKTTYFESGDGSKRYPYIISNPVHFYNLAWLQYLGYFNLGGYINNGRAQSFFKLDFNGDNLDLNGLDIPPIGTREYPFIGYLDGNGKTVSNFTVSNDKSDLTVRPLAARFTTDGVLITTGRRAEATVDILGLFGVTGDFNSFIGDYNYAEKTAGNDLTVIVNEKAAAGTLVPLPGDVEEDVKENEFYYSGMNIHSFYADKIRINSVSDNVLVGLVAGYVSSTIENVGVYRSRVTVSGVTGGATGINNAAGTAVTYDGVISNYSIVGDYDKEIVGWTEVPGGAGGTTGDDGSWGGSIDMKMINRRVNYMFTEAGESDNRTLNSSVYNATISLSTSNEYYWNDSSSSSSSKLYAYLKSGTYLPLNVDNHTMMLDSESGAGYDDTVDDRHTNAYYHTKDENGNLKPEIVNKKSNSGYLVGNGSYNGLAPRLSRQGVNAIGYSLNGATYSSSFIGSNLTLLTTSANGDTNYKITPPSGTSVYSEIAGLPDKLPGDFSYYDSVRNEFISSMEGKKTVHGFHFMSSMPKTGGNGDLLLANNVTINGKDYDSYQFVKGCLNFSVKSNNVLRVIVGTYFANNKDGHSLFDLFKVTRDGDKNVTGVERVEKIYYNKATGAISYTDETIGDLAIDLVEINENKMLKTLKSAYYFEIPIISGDYLIGGVDGTGNTPYIMYLDIGANGSTGGGSGGETKELPYIMQSVDFVAMKNGDTGDTLTVPSENVGAKTFPNYADVGFRLTAAADEIFYKRENYDNLPADDGSIETVVYFYHTNTAVTITIVSEASTKGEENENNAKWE